VKINKKCDEVQKNIISENFDSSITSHLNECSECAEFANFAKQIKIVLSKELSSLKVPEQLDLAIKGEASRFLHKKNSFIIFIKSREFISLAIAATLIIVSSIVFLIKEDIQTQKIENKTQAYEQNSNKNQSLPDKKLDSEKEKLDIEDGLFILSTNFILCKELIEFSLNLDNIFYTEENNYDYTPKDNLI